jgi:4'-phosphopantetheinyl transferase
MTACPGPAQAAPASGEVHVWRAHLNQAPHVRTRIEGQLCAAERARADRYVRPRDGERFLLGRGFLHEVLSAYVGRRPVELRFAYGPHGKPYLDSPLCSWLSFNMSHSDDLAVVAVAAGCAIGIDVERIRDDVDVDALIGRLMDAPPAGAPAATRRRAFFTHWSRQEARWKARGCGLMGLDNARLAPPGEYSIVDLAIAASHSAALAVAQPPARVMLRDWTWGASS